MDVTTESFERDVSSVRASCRWWSTSGPPGAAPAARSARYSSARQRHAAASSSWSRWTSTRTRSFALRYQIQGIPAVKAFRDGQVVREFVGALPPASVAQFLDELTGPSATEKLIVELQESGHLPDVVAALEQDEHEQALELLIEEISAAEGARRERLLALTVGLFGDLGHEHPVTVHYRRRLAASLY